MNHVKFVLIDCDSLLISNKSEDLVAIKELFPLVNVGAVASMDPAHWLVALGQWGLPWQFLKTSFPKPLSHDVFWREIGQSLLFSAKDCLLVSANAATLDAGKAAGFETALIPEGEGFSPLTSTHLPIANLEQLEAGLKADRGQAVRYRVIATAVHAKTSREFLRWMREEHAADLLAVEGCRECRVFRLSPTTLSCEYLFSSQAALDTYLQDKAAELRAKGRARFPEGTISFERDDSSLELQR